jgi:DNA polymerase III subunit delta'
MPTIISRCQIILLHPQSRQVIERALVDRWHAPADRAELLARLSGGRLGRALTLLESEPLLAQRSSALDRLQTLVQEGWGRRLLLAEEMSRRPAQIRETLETWVSWWRDLLLLREGLTDHLTNLDREAELVQMHLAFRVDEIHSALNALQTCADCIQKNVGARLALEWLMLRLPRPGA